MKALLGLIVFSSFLSTSLYSMNEEPEAHNNLAGQIDFDGAYEITRDLMLNKKGFPKKICSNDPLFQEKMSVFENFCMSIHTLNVGDDFYIDNGYRYKIKSELGSGTFGTVFCVKFKKEDEEGREGPCFKLAIKCECSDEKKHTRMEELWCLNAMNAHPHSVPFYGYVQRVSSAFFYFTAMQVMKGDWASECVYELSPKEKLKLMKTGCLALHGLHHHDWGHFDLRPQNILVGEDGNSYLADYGYAHKFDENICPPLGDCGLYVPLEVKEDMYDVESHIKYKASYIDIFTLGLCMMDLCCAYDFEEVLKKSGAMYTQNERRKVSGRLLKEYCDKYPGGLYSPWNKNVIDHLSKMTDDSWHKRPKMDSSCVLFEIYYEQTK